MTLRKIAEFVILGIPLIGRVLTGCSGEEDVRELWKRLPEPDEVGLNGSTDQFAMILSETVALPTGFAW